jgi:hypothetical protein
MREVSGAGLIILQSKHSAVDTDDANLINLSGIDHEKGLRREPIEVEAITRRKMCIGESRWESLALWCGCTAPS